MFIDDHYLIIFGSILAVIAVLLAGLLFKLWHAMWFVEKQWELSRHIIHSEIKDAAHIIGSEIRLSLGESRYVDIKSYDQRHIMRDTPLLEIINSAEREYGVRFTRAGRDMLLIPIMEQIEDGRDISWNDVDMSIHRIIETIKEGRSRRPERSYDERMNSLAVIRGFSKRFCNIPPFCEPTE